MSVLVTIVVTVLAFTLLSLCAGLFRTFVLKRRAEAIVPRAGELQTVEGGEIHFVELGNPNKQTLLMIHGLSGQLQHFTYELADRLAQDHHVLVIDRPGCGYSTRDDASQAELPEQARMIGEFLDAKGIQHAVLAGHSLGGAVALALALARPKLVIGLALLCPFTHPVQRPPAIFRPLAIRSPIARKLLGYTIAVPIANFTAAKTIEMAFAPEPAPTDFIDRAGGALGLRPKGFISASEDMEGANASIGAQSKRYGKLDVPGAILFGAEDTILQPTQHGAPMKKYGLRCEFLAERGHMLPITAPDECEEFIRGVSIATRVPAALK